KPARHKVSACARRNASDARAAMTTAADRAECARLISRAPRMANAYACRTAAARPVVMTVVAVRADRAPPAPNARRASAGDAAMRVGIAALISCGGSCGSCAAGQTCSDAAYTD